MSDTSLFIPTGALNKQIQTAVADPFHAQVKRDDVFQAAHCQEFTFKANGWYPKMHFVMERIKANTNNLLEPLLDNQIEHFDVSRVKNDSRRVTVLKTDRNRKGEWHYFSINL